MFIYYVHILIGKGRVQNISRELDTIKFFKHPPYNLSHNLILSRKTWFSYLVSFGGCFLELVRKITFPIDLLFADWFRFLRHASRPLSR